MKIGQRIFLWCLLVCFMLLNAISLWLQHRNTQEMVRILDYQKMLLTTSSYPPHIDTPRVPGQTTPSSTGTLLNLLITPEFFHGRELYIEGYARSYAKTLNSNLWDLYLLEEYAVYDFRDYSIRLANSPLLSKMDPNKLYRVCLRGYYNLAAREFSITRVCVCDPLKCEIKPSLRPSANTEYPATEVFGEKSDIIDAI